MKTTYKTVKDFLGGASLVKEPISNDYDLVRISRKGLNIRNLLYLANELSMSKKDISNILPVSERTLHRYHRYSKNQLLSPDVTDQVIQIAKLYASGIEVFGDKTLFIKWMKLSNIALGGDKPIDLLDTSFGIEMVNDEIGRLEHGIIS